MRQKNFLHYRNYKVALSETEEPGTFEFRNRRKIETLLGLQELPSIEPILSLTSSLYNFTESQTFTEEQNKFDRNLVYFTINGDENYWKLLELCIESIISSGGDLSNIDFLIISDSREVYTHLSKTFPEIPFYFLEVPTTSNGVEASMNKLRIFDFPLIHHYDKILFLDCDIIFTRPIQEIFQEDIEDGKLYSMIHGGATRSLHQTKYHNLVKYSEKDLDRLEDHGIMPFNAGQFLMVSSRKMEQHFRNILHLVSIWKREFFYEQSFMNLYFNYNYASDTSLLNKYFCIYYIHNNDLDSEIDPRKNLHYAGNSCNCESKIEFIRKYRDQLL